MPSQFSTKTMPCPSCKAYGFVDLAEAEMRCWHVIKRQGDKVVMLVRHPHEPVGSMPNNISNKPTADRVEQYFLPEDQAQKYIQLRSVDYALSKMNLLAHVGA